MRLRWARSGSVANTHDHEHHDDHAGCTHGALHSHANCHGQEGVRILKLGTSVFEENGNYAEQNRRYLRERSVRMLNLVSSPGAGKTTLLARSIGDLKDHFDDFRDRRRSTDEP